MQVFTCFQKSTFGLAAKVALVIGSLWMLFGIGLFAYAISFYSQAKLTQGNVVRFQERKVPGRDLTEYEAIIRFSTQTDEVIETVASKSGERPNLDSLPIKVDVWYSVSNPKNIRIGSQLRLFAPSLFILITGSLIFCLGWYPKLNHP